MKRWPVALTALLLFAAGCGHPDRGDVRFRVAAADALFDAPLGVTLAGVPKGARVTVSAAAADYAGGVWKSAATFTPDRSGVVDPAAAAPLTGAYTGVHDTGLLWSMTGPGEDFYVMPAAGMTVRLTATVDGRPVAQASVVRHLAVDGVTRRATTVAADGFAGAYYAPRDTSVRRPAVLAFGGSEGGTGAGTINARALADQGYPALGIGYFKAAGLPGALQRIPLEYFAAALRWLAAQPGVDPARIYVEGASRGSEAALLLGEDYPGLVHGVIALSPSSAVNPGYPDANQPAWTLHGRPVPHVAADRYGITDPPAVMPVERIRGPVLLLCGELDNVWPSCAYADALAARLGAHPHLELREPGAGHYVDSVLPDLPVRADAVAGGGQQADALARLDAWPKLLGLLATGTLSG